MEHILEQIRATFDSGSWYPVVSSVLMLPDACGAIEFWGSGDRPKDRYIKWYDKWVEPRFRASNLKFDGEVLYIVRNALIHESTGFSRGKYGLDRILFMPPNNQGISIEFFLSSNNGGIEETAFQVTILGLMNAMEHGVRDWLADIRNDDNKRRQKAIENLIQYRPEGQWPHVIGIPIVS